MSVSNPGWTARLERALRKGACPRTGALALLAALLLSLGAASAQAARGSAAADPGDRALDSAANVPAARQDAAHRASDPEWSDAPAPYIRRVIYEREPIFTESDCAQVPWLPLGLVNAVHIDTRRRTIRRELLVHEGDRADPELLAESERKLRATGYLVEVSLETEHVAPDSVDLYVHTREVWTTNFDIRFEKFENTTLLSFRAMESNLLGTGRQASLARNEDLDRTSWELGYRDRHFLDGKWDGGADYSDASDGGSFAWHLDRPFFQLESQWAWRAQYLHAGTSPRYYLTGDKYVRPHGDFSQARLELQRRSGRWGEGVLRLGVGFRVETQRFSPLPAAPIYDPAGNAVGSIDLGGKFAENRDVYGPIVTLDRTPLNYASRRYLDRMGQREDIAKGHQLSLALGWISRGMGSSFDGSWFSGEERWNIISGGTVVRLDASATGHLAAGSDPNMRAQFRARLNQYFSDAFSAAGSLLAATGSNLDRNSVYTLGIDNGLRSARPSEYAGDRLLRANLEMRWVYRSGFGSLVTPGMAAFADFGTAWFEDEHDLLLGDMRGAVGFGFRLGMDRASLNAPLRVDFAWPILYSTHRSAPVVSIGVGQAF